MLTGPRTFMVEKVTKGTAEQPVEIHLVEFPGRPFKPSKTVRRILVAAWGSEASAYVGRRMTLYRDPAVKFGGMDVGGIRVSHLSHLDKRITLALTVTRGKRAPFTVEPLPDVPAAMSPEDATEFERRIAEAVTLPDLEAVAADLKARDLGSHRGHLLSAWSERKSAIANAPIGILMASPEQVAQLAQIRAQEQYDADADWAGYLLDVFGYQSPDLTAEQAATVISTFNEEAAK